MGASCMITVSDVTLMSSVPAILLSVPRETLETFTGNMLGDGSVRYSNFSRDQRITGNARYAMTMSVEALGYVTSLIEKVYKDYGAVQPRPYPNVTLPQHAGKSVTQYAFQTASLPIFSALHTL